ncbi:MAG: KH domain-containing protein [Coriobacteriales bacterium]|jgi:predicted RNA-binding protein YlqC (UPF0109 family)|nr:KH domain-containing protein [Coriobacteriales bacterium]
MMAENPRDAVSLVSVIINSLVDDVDQVEIRASEESDSLLIEIVVASDEISKVIGRNGRVIKAIRTLTRASAALDGIDRVDVEIIS